MHLRINDFTINIETINFLKLHMLPQENLERLFAWGHNFGIYSLPI